MDSLLYQSNVTKRLAVPRTGSEKVYLVLFVFLLLGSSSGRRSGRILSEASKAWQRLQYFNQKYGEDSKRGFRLEMLQISRGTVLSEVNKRRRYEKCLILRKRFTGGTHQSIVFSDEKIFTVEMAYNRQNSRILAPDQKSISSSIRTSKRTQKPASVMVWGAITSDGRTPLVFIDKGVKINKEVYVESILENALKPWPCEHFNGTHWVFQQDSAPSHKAKMTSEWLKLNVPEFISTEE
ncbi:hypothetical protein LOD99_15913 [Oopsacas minuta]|uniref:Transposase n=1 Tax=Oopsacas minuta TaxID=111878 RepID=A0AAV7K705_9METZ|nr:hypothetical protein LOD99_15913 [Oopsacas minuta]